MTKEQVLGKYWGDQSLSNNDCCTLAMQEYADQQQRLALEKFKSDAIYCHGDGIASMNIEYYLNPVLR